jgi:hypothetical protein
MSTYLEVHLPQSLTPLDQERRTNVQMKLRECVGTLRLDDGFGKHCGYGSEDIAYQVCVPHPNRIPYTYLSHQQTVHPSEGKLYKLHVLPFEVSR